jgi:hypothetical protein
MSYRLERRRAAILTKSSIRLISAAGWRKAAF